jgi:hypothetical protein
VTEECVRACKKAAALLRPSAASFDDLDSKAVKMRTLEVRRVLDGSVNLYTREKIENIYNVGVIYKTAGARLRAATRLEELSEAAVLKLIEEHGGELAPFVQMVWEGPKLMAPVSGKAVTIQR